MALVAKNTRDKELVAGDVASEHWCAAGAVFRRAARHFRRLGMERAHSVRLPQTEACASIKEVPDRGAV
jgi:hypothetical protein